MSEQRNLQRFCAHAQARLSIDWWNMPYALYLSQRIRNVVLIVYESHVKSILKLTSTDSYQVGLEVLILAGLLSTPILCTCELQRILTRLHVCSGASEY